jgi:hypothetical protein
VKSRIAAAVVLFAALAGLSSGCLGDDATATQVFKCPSRASFTGEPEGGGATMVAVSAFMERRCGTLDCHGSLYRPMRLLGRYGLRDPAQKNITGGAATTAAELDANYAAVCNVEPEQMDKAAEDFGQSAEKLLILQKARGVEGHKGGTIVSQGTPGDDCILGWLRGDPLSSVGPRCQAALGGL